MKDQSGMSHCSECAKLQITISELRESLKKRETLLDEWNEKLSRLRTENAALKKPVCMAEVEKFGYVEDGQSLFRPDQIENLLAAQSREAQPREEESNVL